MGLQTVWTVAEASSLALKAELMEKSPRNFSSIERYSPQSNWESTGDKEKNATPRDSNLENKGASSSSSVQHGKAPTQRPNNTYARPAIDICYRCNGRGHKSNVCPTRRVAVVVEEREEDEEREDSTFKNDEYADVEFAVEESDERVNFVLQVMLLASKDEGQRKNLFKTHFSIENKVCNLIVDSGSMVNLVSKKLVDYLKLSTKPHEKPYNLGWVSKGSQVLVTLTCRVPISIGKHYREEILCDVLDMDVCHILLGRPWQFNNDITYRGRDNVMMFTWGTHKIAMAPVLHFDKNPGGKNPRFLMMTQSEKELNEAVKETKCFCPVVIKGLMNAVKEETIPE